jgi:hypothetical protein
LPCGKLVLEVLCVIFIIFSTVEYVRYEKCPRPFVAMVFWRRQLPADWKLSNLKMGGLDGGASTLLQNAS